MSSTRAAGNLLIGLGVITGVATWIALGILAFKADDLFGAFCGWLPATIGGLVFGGIELRDRS